VSIFGQFEFYEQYLTHFFVFSLLSVSFLVVVFHSHSLLTI